MNPEEKIVAEGAVRIAATLYEQLSRLTGDLGSHLLDRLFHRSTELNQKQNLTPQEQMEQQQLNTDLERVYGELVPANKAELVLRTAAMRGIEATIIPVLTDQGTLRIGCWDKDRLELDHSIKFIEQQNNLVLTTIEEEKQYIPGISTEITGLDRLQTAELSKELQALGIQHRIEREHEYFNIRVATEHTAELKESLKRTLLNLNSRYADILKYSHAVLEQSQQMIHNMANTEKDAIIYDSGNPEHFIECKLNEREKHPRIIEHFCEGKAVEVVGLDRSNTDVFTKQLEHITAQMQVPMVTYNIEEFQKNLQQQEFTELSEPAHLVEAAYRTSAYIAQEGDIYHMYNMTYTPGKGITIEPDGGFVAGEIPEKDMSAVENIDFLPGNVLAKDIEINENIQAVAREYEDINHDGIDDKKQNLSLDLDRDGIDDAKEERNNED